MTRRVSSFTRSKSQPTHSIVRYSVLWKRDRAPSNSLHIRNSLANVSFHNPFPFPRVSNSPRQQARQPEPPSVPTTYPRPSQQHSVSAAARDPSASSPTSSTSPYPRPRPPHPPVLQIQHLVLCPNSCLRRSCLAS